MSAQQLPNAPRQDRSRRSAQQILDAAVTVLADGGIRDFTMTGVSQTAGLSVGGVYGRYPTKEVLLREVKNAVLGELEQAVHDQTEKASTNLQDTLTGLISVIAESLHTRSRLFTFVFLHSSHDPLMRRRGFQFHERVKNAFSAALLRSSWDARPVSPDSVDILYETVMHSLISRAVTAGSIDLGEPTYSGAPHWQLYARELATMCSLYLQTAPRPAPPLGDSHAS